MKQRLNNLCSGGLEDTQCKVYTCTHNDLSSVPGAHTEPRAVAHPALGRQRQEGPWGLLSASLAGPESSRVSETLSQKHEVEMQLTKIPDVNLWPPQHAHTNAHTCMSGHAQ